MSVAAVVVTFNSAEVLGRCLESLHSVPVFVVDNGSTDSTIEIARSFSNVRPIRTSRNGGFGFAANVGCRAAGDADYIAVLNPDATLHDAALDLLVEAMERDRSLGAIAPRFEEGASGRTAQSLWVVAARRTAFGRTRLGHSIAERHVSGVRDGDIDVVDWIVGAAMLLRRDALRTVGGFDPRFFLYHEDHDLCLRMTEAGWRIAVLNSARATHGYKRASATPANVRAAWHHAVSTLRFYRRHPAVMLRLPDNRDGAPPD